MQLHIHSSRVQPQFQASAIHSFPLLAVLTNGEGLVHYVMCHDVIGQNGQMDGAKRQDLCRGFVVVSSGGAPTPAGTSVFTKHNWDMGMGCLWLNGRDIYQGWSIYGLLGGAFMT